MSKKVVSVNDPGFYELLSDYYNSGKKLYNNETPSKRFQSLVLNYSFATVTKDLPSFEGYGSLNNHTLITIEEARKELGLVMNNIDVENGKYIVSFTDPQATELLYLLKEKYGKVYTNFSKWKNFQVNFKNTAYNGMGCNDNSCNGEQVKASDIIKAIDNSITAKKVVEFISKIVPNVNISMENGTLYVANTFMFNTTGVKGKYYHKAYYENGDKVKYQGETFVFRSNSNSYMIVNDSTFKVLDTKCVSELEKIGVTKEEDN